MINLPFRSVLTSPNLVDIAYYSGSKYERNLACPILDRKSSLLLAGGKLIDKYL